jgi:uncharacterized protein (DUF1697 family)
MDQFPQMLYKVGNAGDVLAFEGTTFSTLVVDSADAFEAAHADGFRVGPNEAKEAHAAAVAAEAEAAAAAAAAAEAKPATREELEQKATELGVKFSAAMSDKKLAAEIAAKLGK